MMSATPKRAARAAALKRMAPVAVALMAIAMSAPVLAASAMDSMDMKGMDHSNMPGMKPAPSKKAPTEKPDATPDAMKSMDHSGMPGMEQKPGMRPQMRGMEKGAMGDMGAEAMGPMQGGKPPADARDPDAYAEGVPRGHMRGMDMADDNLYGFALLDKLEYAGQATLRLDAQAWYGGDYNKLWLKADGERNAGRLGAMRAEALWNRSFATYWSSQLGVRHDFGGGPSRNWAALGVQGIAPYWFDIQATAYVGPSGRLAARAEVDYDLLITQRLILQPNIEVNVYGRDDAARGIGSGVSDVEAGLRLRYEIKRQFAPYIGVSWRRKVGDTADLAKAAGEDVRETRFVAGVRIWF